MSLGKSARGIFALAHIVLGAFLSLNTHSLLFTWRNIIWHVTHYDAALKLIENYVLLRHNIICFLDEYHDLSC